MYKNILAKLMICMLLIPSLVSSEEQQLFVCGDSRDTSSTKTCLTIDELFELSKTYESQDLYSKALEVTEKILDFYSSNDMYFGYAAHYARYANQDEKGLQYGMQAISMNDRVEWYYVTTALSAYNLNQKETAKIYAEKALTFGEDNLGQANYNSMLNLLVVVNIVYGLPNESFSSPKSHQQALSEIFNNNPTAAIESVSAIRQLGLGNQQLILNLLLNSIESQPVEQYKAIALLVINTLQDLTWADYRATVLNEMLKVPTQDERFQYVINYGLDVIQNPLWNIYPPSYRGWFWNVAMEYTQPEIYLSNASEKGLNMKFWLAEYLYKFEYTSSDVKLYSDNIFNQIISKEIIPSLSSPTISPEPSPELGLDIIAQDNFIHVIELNDTLHPIEPI